MPLLGVKNRSMFILEASFVALLEIIATRYRLTHLGFVNEFGYDDARLVGVELGIPVGSLQVGPLTPFFLSQALPDAFAREHAAF